MRAALLALSLAALYAFAPAQSTCSAKCDKDAASCVDACESKFGDDAPKRVGCKVECASKRRDCDAQCK